MASGSLEDEIDDDDGVWRSSDWDRVGEIGKMGKRECIREEGGDPGCVCCYVVCICVFEWVCG